MTVPCNILIDFHGVLTNGKQTISNDGAYMFDHVNVRDTRAIRELVARGFDVTIVTASSSPIIQSYASKVGVQLLVARDKSQILVSFGDYIAIGDDAWDVVMLEKARRAFCPRDADWSVKKIEGIEILETKGGDGCLSELLRKIL